MREDVEKILNIAIWAPSGDNSQPWRFEVLGGQINVLNVPTKDTSLYNHNQRASLVACGALVENIKIAASHFGYEVSISLFPGGYDSDLVATIFLVQKHQNSNFLYSWITKRVSNRKPYKTDRLTDDEKSELISAASSFGDIRILIADDRGLIAMLADAASVNERVVLENKKLRQFLFDHITWSTKEDIEKKGFFVKTLELKGAQIIGFRLFRYQFFVRILNKLGISRLVSRDNAKLYKQSGVIVAITAPSDSPQSYLKSGMAMQRFWLTATEMNLGVQPLTGIGFLYFRIKSGGKEIAPHHAELIQTAYMQIAKGFGVTSDVITMMFRVGRADRPSAKCLRKKPNIAWLEK
ncbi:MAG: nitroreductase family protein [Patescibacteria group bacterium]